MEPAQLHRWPCRHAVGNQGSCRPICNLILQHARASICLLSVTVFHSLGMHSACTAVAGGGQHSRVTAAGSATECSAGTHLLQAQRIVLAPGILRWHRHRVRHKELSSAGEAVRLKHRGRWAGGQATPQHPPAVSLDINQIERSLCRQIADATGHCAGTGTATTSTSTAASPAGETGDETAASTLLPGFGMLPFPTDTPCDCLLTPIKTLTNPGSGAAPEQEPQGMLLLTPIKTLISPWVRSRP